MKLFVCLALPVLLAAQDVPVPPVAPLEVPSRIGIEGEVHIGLRDVIARVLENDPDIMTSRILRDEAVLNVKGAKGAFDPIAGLTASRVRSVAPVASVLSGSADGKLGSEQYLADPSVSGYFPRLAAATDWTSRLRARRATAHSSV